MITHLYFEMTHLPNLIDYTWILRINSMKLTNYSFFLNNQNLIWSVLNAQLDIITGKILSSQNVIWKRKSGEWNSLFLLRVQESYLAFSWDANLFPWMKLLLLNANDIKNPRKLIKWLQEVAQNVIHRIKSLQPREWYIMSF